MNPYESPACLPINCFLVFLGVLRAIYGCLLVVMVVEFVPVYFLMVTADGLSELFRRSCLTFMLLAGILVCELMRAKADSDYRQERDKELNTP